MELKAAKMLWAIESYIVLKWSDMSQKNLQLTEWFSIRKHGIITKEPNQHRINFETLTFSPGLTWGTLALMTFGGTSAI